MKQTLRPTEKDIETTPNGYYRLPCDGRHDMSNHFYLYYTKKEVMKLWREDHSKNQNEGEEEPW